MTARDAAYPPGAKDGTARLKQQAQWLKSDHPSAAASLLEGVVESFIMNCPRLPQAFIRCLNTTNLIENPTGRCVV